jgi:chemotaxis protein histidine kinase CheA
MGRTRYVSSAAILSDGRVGLIVNVEEIAMLIQKAHNYYQSSMDAVAATAPPSFTETRT